VWKDERAPHFLGDLPHAWVGSDFVRSVLDMLAYERESDDALVLGAGIPSRWLASPTGIEVHELCTRWGHLDFTMRRDASGGGVVVAIPGSFRVPAGGIVIQPPGRFRGASVNGKSVPLSPEGAVTVRSLPAIVRLSP